MPCHVGTKPFHVSGRVYIPVRWSFQCWRISLGCCSYVDTSGEVVEYCRISTVLSKYCINLRYLEYSLI